MTDSGETGGRHEPVFAPDCAVLTVDEMYRADQAAIDSGLSGDSLMEAAGRAVAGFVLERRERCPVVVLCGPGDNGGDGFVVARLLDEAGWPVRVALLGDRERLKGDARRNAERWRGEVEPVSVAALDEAALVIDALFGAGLARPLDGAARATVEAINQRGVDCVSVDMPSGVHGDTGAILGAAPQAGATVTFFRRKPGHLLYPGRGACGEVVVADIGIPDMALAEIAPRQAMNDPALWLDRFPWPRPAQHKFTRGHALVAGGAEMTGAARLAAEAARRAGAGLVTVLTSPAAADIYRIALAGALVAAVENEEAFASKVEDKRSHAVLIGPGNGVGPSTRNRTLRALRTGKPVLLDADALTVFADEPDLLFDAIRGPCVMTPHEGEFARLFGAIDPAGGRLVAARSAAAGSGAVIVLKGPDTVIAAPDGRAAINANAPPTLATAGAGDVLAGFILSLLAQGMDPFDAACCGVWIHGAAATDFGPGMIAEDIISGLPAVLKRLSLTGSGIGPGPG